VPLSSSAIPAPRRRRAARWPFTAPTEVRRKSRWTTTRDVDGYRVGCAKGPRRPEAARLLWSRTQGLGSDHLFTVAAPDATQFFLLPFTG
jgi:hypothetical protein